MKAIETSDTQKIRVLFEHDLKGLNDYCKLLGNYQSESDLSMIRVYYYELCGIAKALSLLMGSKYVVTQSSNSNPIEFSVRVYNH